MKALSEDVADTISDAANALPVIDKLMAECSNAKELAEQLGRPSPQGISHSDF
jgi:hypothetical protein